MRSFARRACVFEGERKRERGGHSAASRMRAHACVCVREIEREGDMVTTATCMQIHTSIITVSVMRLCSPFGLQLMVKLSTLLTVFTYILKAKACYYGKERYISHAACGVQPITMHFFQLANQSSLRLLEGGTL